MCRIKQYINGLNKIKLNGNVPASIAGIFEYPRSNLKILPQKRKLQPSKNSFLITLLRWNSLTVRIYTVMKTKIVIWDGCILADRFIYRNHRVRKEFDRLYDLHINGLVEFLRFITINLKRMLRVYTTPISLFTIFTSLQPHSSPSNAPSTANNPAL